LSCASLARELDVSETTAHEMVRRGVLRCLPAVLEPVA
jgi:predicted DNA binding protein